jgi:hypothetical protein
MDAKRRQEKAERARIERIEREERMKTELGQKREKMAAFFENLVKFRTKKYDADDEEMIHYQFVEVYQKFTKEGPHPGEKFKNVDLNTDTGDLIFRLKTGGRRMVVLTLEVLRMPDKPNKPATITYGGDFDPPEEREEEDVDEDGEFIIPKGRQSRL